MLVYRNHSHLILWQISDYVARVRLNILLSWKILCNTCLSFHSRRIKIYVRIIFSAKLIILTSYPLSEWLLFCSCHHQRLFWNIFKILASFRFFVVMEPGFLILVLVWVIMLKLDFHFSKKLLLFALMKGL